MGRRTLLSAAWLIEEKRGGKHKRKKEIKHSNNNWKCRVHASGRQPCFRRNPRINYTRGRPNAHRRSPTTATGETAVANRARQALTRGGSAALSSARRGCSRTACPKALFQTL